MKNLRNVALKVFNAIFEGLSSVEIDGVIYPIRETSRSKLRYVNIEGNSFIEQNPDKASRWAKLAQEGHKIMWVLKGKRYLARVKDGIFLDLKRKEK